MTNSKPTKINNDELFLLKDYTSIDDAQLKQLYNEYGSYTIAEKRSFLHYFLLIAGVGLFVSGVVFFFAFNWNELSSFFKFSIVVIGLLVSTFFSVSNKYSKLINQIALVITSVLIGVLLAVFGQVYQTGANAYDLFLVWSLAVLPLTLVSQAVYQWLGLSILVNTTVFLYFNQVVGIYSTFKLINIELLINVTLLFLPYIIIRKQHINALTFYKQTQLFVLSIAVLNGIWYSLFNYLKYSESSPELAFTIFSVFSVILIVGGAYFSFKKKDMSVFSCVLLIVITTILMFFIKLFDYSYGASLFYMLYVLVAVYFVIKVLGKIKKKWSYEA